MTGMENSWKAQPSAMTNSDMERDVACIALREVLGRW